MDQQAKLDKGVPMTALTVGESVRKADTAALITNGTDAFPEDTFSGAYWTSGQWGGNDVAIIEPAYKPGTLHALTIQNNILSQCVEAMEVNIDGTGHSISLVHESDEELDEDDSEKTMLEDFFAEPYPGKSMIEIRRAIRRDRESTGNGYMEVIRNVADEVMMLNHVEANDMRLVGFDAPVVVEKELTRNGKVLKVQVRARERRFVQLINGKKVFFKEFGAKRDLDRNTGQWVKEGQRLPIESRASEVIHFPGKKEPKTAYGSPRWINQLPSALGSRKAEEFNLEYFDGGGIPPLLIMVQGGYIAEQTKIALNTHFSAKGNKHRAAIVEAVSSSGSIDSAGNVQIRVERFGSERQSDAMFQNYDKNCEDHIRVSFRLPPLFLGKASDYNFATAYTAYMVAEAQVFYPERDEFDGKINNTIVKELGAKKFKYRSLPLTLTDVANQLKALELAKEGGISAEELVTKLNEITGLSMKHDKNPVLPPVKEPDPLDGTLPQDPTLTNPGEAGTGMPRPAAKSELMATEDLLTLANDWTNLLGLDGPATYLTAEEAALVRKSVDALPAQQYKLFNQIIASKTLASVGVDLEGLGEMCGCATHLAAE